MRRETHYRQKINWFWGIAVVLFVAVAGWVILYVIDGNNGEDSTVRPTLSVVSMDVTDISADRIAMNATVVLRNPLPIEVTTHRVDYEIYMNDTKIIENQYTEPLTIRSEDTTGVKLPMEVLISRMAAQIEQLEERNADSVDYTIRATIYADVPIAGEQQFTFDKTERMPVFHMLEMTLVNLEIEKLRLQSSMMRLETEIKNPNAFPIEMKDVHFMVTVGEDLELEGEIDGLTSIPPKSSVVVPVDLDISTVRMGRLAWNTLFNRDETTIKVAFRCEIQSDGLLEGSEFAMTSDGTLEELRQAAKEVEQN